MKTGDYIVNVISAVIAVEYMDCGFRKKYRGIKRWVLFAAGCILYFLVVTGFNHFIKHEGIFMITYSCVLFLYGELCLQGNVYDKIFMAVLWIVVLVIGSYVVYDLEGIVTGKSLADMLAGQNKIHFFASVFFCATKFFMGKLITVLYKKRESVHQIEDMGIIGALFLLFLVPLAAFQLEVAMPGQKSRYFVTIGLLVGEFIIAVFLIKIYQRIGIFQKEKLEAQLREMQQKKQREEFYALYQVGREINHWRHDMSGRLDVLYHLLKNGKIEEAENYIEEMDIGLARYPELPRTTGNEGLDAALIKAILKCKEYEIHFSYRILERPRQIDSMDMGILMYNLLNNGIEACVECERKRYVDLIIYKEGSGIVIEMENLASVQAENYNLDFKSHKKDQMQHGFGMESIQSIIEKYSGNYEWKEERGVVSQKVFLKYRD